MSRPQALWRAVTLVVWLVVFFLASGVGVVLHLNLPQSRRVLSRLATSALNQNLQGRFELGEMEQIGAQSLIVNGFSAHDPQGRRVLIASRIALSVDLVTLARRLFTDTDAPLTIAIEHAQIASVEAHWYENQDGTPSLLQTFTPRPSPAATKSSAARPVRVGVRSIALNRGYARGAPAGLPTVELEISQARGWILATQSGAELRFDRFGAVLRGLGGADTRGIASVHVRTPGPLAVSFDGFHEAIQFGAEVRAQAGNVGIAVELPRIQPNDARALFPEYPLLEEASAQLELLGRLPELKLSAQVTTASSAFNAAGPLHLGAAPRAQLEIDGRAVDLAALAPGLPRTRFDARALLDLKFAPKFELVLSGRTAPTVALGTELPALELLASLDREHISGHARAREPGSPVAIDFERTNGGPWKLEIEIPRLVLERSPRVASLKTRGTASLRASVNLDRGAAQGDFELGVTGLERSDAAARELKLAGVFRGRVEDLSRLELTSKLQARDARLLDFPFRERNVSLSGPLGQPVLKLEANDRGGSHYQASARLSPRTEAGQLVGLGVNGLEIAARRGRAELTGKAEQVELRRRQLKIQNLVAQGFGGSLSGSAEVTPSVVHLDARGSGLDLGSLSRFLGLPPHYVRGALAFDADCVLARDIETGTVHVRLEEASVGPLDGLTLTARAALENHRLALDADAQVASLGLGRLQAAVEVPSTVRDLRALQRDALGRVEVEVGRVDLGLLGNLLAPGTSSRLEGVIGIRAVATRARAGTLPDLELTAQSLGLRVPAELAGLKSSVEGLDLGLGLRVAGETGDTETSVKLLDRRGLLASATASARYDLEGTLREPARAVQTVMETPILGKVVIEDRALADWPAFLVPPRGPSGRARAEFTWSGPPRSPDVAAKLRLAGLELTSDGNSQPLDLCLNAAWSNAERALSSSGQLYLTERGRETCGGTRVAHYTLGATASLNTSMEPQLDGNALLVLEAFPLTAVPTLKESGLSGLMSGRASLSRTGGTPAFSANVSLAQLGVRGTSVGDGRLEVRSGQDTVGATLEIGDARSHIQGTVLAALDHSAGFPKLKRGEPVGVRLSAQRANAALLAPLTHEVLADLGGELDAEVTAALVPGTDPTNSAFSSQIGGHAELRRGEFELTSLGLKLSDVDLAARAETEGQETRITFDRLTGHTGEQKRVVRVQRGRLWLKGLEFNRADGAIDASELPLVIQGIPQAIATTRQSIAFTVERTPQEIRAQFQIPYLIVALPQSLGRNVIPLDENRSVTVLQPLAAPKLAQGDTLPFRLSFDLGQNVKLTRSDLDLPLSGQAEVRLGDDVDVRGDLELSPGGRIDVSGKTFVIDSGEVHFDTGEPNNPRIRVTASYRAPGGSIVTADMAGTLKKANLRVSSPGRTEQEAYAILLGSSTSVDDSSAAGARAAGAGVGADRLLGPLLQNTPLHRVELRTGSERVANQRTYSTYTAAVPVAEDIWFEGSYKSLNRTNVNNDTVSAWSGTVDWRFRRNWSLRTEVGTIGTGMDVLWNYRY